MYITDALSRMQAENSNRMATVPEVRGELTIVYGILLLLNGSAISYEAASLGKDTRRAPGNNQVQKTYEDVCLVASSQP